MELHVNKILNCIKTIKLSLKMQCFDVNRIILFGSAVRGELHPHSDIDICIVLLEGSRWDENNRIEIIKIQKFIDSIIGDICEADYVVCNCEKLARRYKVFESIWTEGVVLYGDVLGHS